MDKKYYHLINMSVLLCLVLFSSVSCYAQESKALRNADITSALAAGELAGLPGIIMSQQNVGLWVNGLGKANAKPDIVLLSLGVEAQSTTVAEAQKQAADAMNKVMGVLKNNGIAEKDVQTRQFNIQQVTRWDDKQNIQIVLGYKVTNNVIAKIRNTDKAGPIIDSVAAAAGDLTRINSISFTVDDPTPYFKSAREKAVQEAMEKARQISQVSGVKVGKALYINENTVSTSPVRDTYLKYSLAEAAPAPTPISAGELEFQVSVEIVYEIN